MAKIIRKTHAIFGDLGASSNFAQFGSLQGGTPIKTKDIASIQSLAAWDNGFQDALYSGNKALLLEDLNAWAYLHSYMIGYGLQEGIAEWDTSTTYFKNSIVKLPLILGGSEGAPQLFASNIDTNLGHTPPAGSGDANWTWINPPPPAPPTAIPIGGIMPFGGLAAPSGFSLCNGQALDGGLPANAALFAVIGTTWGNGGPAHSGEANWFNVPDLRGVGLRGANKMGSGDTDAADAYADPDKTTRGARLTGGAVGDNIGSFQQDEFKSHTHGAGRSSNFTIAGSNAAMLNAGTAFYTGATGGSESRMKNAYVMYIIKL
jgi:microcystin-dependent protein